MKNLNKTILLFFLLATSFCLNAQNEFSKWYFGGQAGLDFVTSPPTILTNGIVNTSEGVAAISDVAGNLLFYTDGVSVANSAHVLMANGSGLFGNTSSTQAATIVKKPGSTNIYYVFTVGNSANGLCYSVVDMSLAAGMGSVTIKNVPMFASTCEKQVLVRHCNGKDVWIVSHDYGSNQFRTFLMNSSGVVLSPVLSPVGESVAGGIGWASIGQLKSSPDGKKLAAATFTSSVPTSMGYGGFHLFDFDAASGIVSNSLTILSGSVLATSVNTGAYGLEFSPDGTKLYGTTSPGSAPNASCTLFQWNICAGNNAAIISSQYSVDLSSLTTVGSAQIAIDGKIYISAVNVQSLSVINNPNNSGAAMNFVLNGQSIAPKSGRLGLPNYINPYTRSLPQPFTNTVACQTTSFSIPSIPTFSSGCSSTPYAPSSYLWDFGEPASGAANTSTLTNPVHTYSTLGTYSVSLILYSNCTNDTLKKVVTISATNPTVSVAGVFDICKGDKRTYTVTGATSYKWSNNVTTPTTTFAPISTSVYSVTGTVSGCSSSKLFTINVNPCLGIATNQISDGFSVYPNPVKDLLSVESLNPASMMIFDMNGKLLQENKLRKGHNEINTLGLKPGIYNIQASDEKGVWRGRLVKIE